MIFKLSSGSNCLAHPGMLKILPSQNFFSSGKVRTVPSQVKMSKSFDSSQGLYQRTVSQITSPFLKNWSIFVACLNCFQLVSAFPRSHISQIFQSQFFTIFAGPILCCCSSICALFSKPICSLHNRIMSHRVKWCNSSHCRLTSLLEPNCSDLLCFILGSSGIIVSALI